MQEHEVFAAALRWHTAYIRRLEMCAEQGRFKREQKQQIGCGVASCEIGARLTAARKVELAAARQLARACTTARLHQNQVDDVVAIDPRTKLLQTHLIGP